jgi:aquaporin Z
VKKYITEFIGTFILIFVGTGSVIVNHNTHGALGLVGVALVWGLVVAALIYTFGRISGAHFNPAVTITFWMVKLLKGKDVVPYIICQLIGAFAASLVLKFIFPDEISLGETKPKGDAMQSFVLEAIMCFILMMVILFTSQGAKETGILAGLAIGGTILVLVLFGGPVSGTSLNPTRSIAPAVVSGKYLEHLWIYITAPLMGMFTAGIVWMLLKEKTSSSSN